MINTKREGESERERERVSEQERAYVASGEHGQEAGAQVGGDAEEQWFSARDHDHTGSQVTHHMMCGRTHLLLITVQGKVLNTHIPTQQNMRWTAMNMKKKTFMSTLKQHISPIIIYEGPTHKM